MSESKEVKLTNQTIVRSSAAAFATDGGNQHRPMERDRVNHPAHYSKGGVEAIDVIEAWRLGFNLGNVVKYIARAGHKPDASFVDDLKKARWYLERQISQVEVKS